MFQTTIFLRKIWAHCIKRTNNHHLPSYHTDILTIGVLAAMFSFIIGMFLSVSFFQTTSNPQNPPITSTQQLPPPQSKTYQWSESLISQYSQQDDQGIQTPRDIILTSINGEQQNADAEEPQEIAEQQKPLGVAFKGQQYRVRRTMRMTLTAYSSTPDQTDSTPFITASNTRVKWGTVAANFLPFQTKIRIPGMFGDKVFVVEDRMNKRYWHRVDVWMPTRQEAINFGLRVLDIEILEPIPPIQTT